MEIFINATGCISPQTTYEDSSFTLAQLQQSSSGRFKTVDPEYKNYINPSLLRRMSRMIRMGVASSKICLERGGLSMPDAIITGTGLGCIEDTEKFITSIIDNHEQLLTPTPFIQSTHNTVGGQIALLLGCHAYNYTYVHRGLSFESALLDAIMMTEEGTGKNILVGGIDELTENSYKILQQLGIYSRKETLSTDLTDGTPAGEGAVFFIISSEKTTTSLAKVSLVKSFPGMISSSDLSHKIQQSISESGKTNDDIGYVLSGQSGNVNHDHVLHQVIQTLFKDRPFATFKQYCGEYHTASAFGLWLAINYLKQVPSVLLFNHFGGEDHSIILLERC